MSQRIGLRGNLQESPYFMGKNGKNRWFPADFPLNQSKECLFCGISGRFPTSRSFAKHQPPLPTCQTLLDGPDRSPGDTGKNSRGSWSKQNKMTGQQNKYYVYIYIYYRPYAMQYVQYMCIYILIDVYSIQRTLYGNITGHPSMTILAVPRIHGSTMFSTNVH